MSCRESEMKSAFFSGALGCAALLMSQGVAAGPVTVWNFETGSPALSCADAHKADAVCDPSVSFDQGRRIASWGTAGQGGQRSGLEVLGGRSSNFNDGAPYTFDEFIDTSLEVGSSDFVPLSLDTWASVATVVHYNNTMQESPGLLRFVTDVPIILSAAGTGSPLFGVSGNFGLEVIETDDQAACFPSPNPSASESGCDDTLRAFHLNAPSFVHEGYRYQLNLRLEPDDGLATDSLDSLPYLYSGEGTAGLAFLQARLTASSVPAPGVFTLIGLGGVLMLRRRRRC